MHRLQILVNELSGGNVTAFERDIGVSQSRIDKIIKRDSRINMDIVQKIADKFPYINRKWIEEGVGDLYVPSRKEFFKLNDYADQIGDEVEEYRNKSNKFVKLADGRYKMVTKLVTQKARAGYLAGLGDEEYIDDLPEQTWTLTEADLDSGLPKGTYRSFEITGDSMFNGGIESFPDRTVVLARLVPASNWQNSRLHIPKRRFFIIVTIEGQLCKEILEHNVQGKEILIHSLNPNKDLYPDGVINLRSVLQIWNIVKKELPV